MKTENQSCCFCFRIASGGNKVNSDILILLKFLIANLNTNSLENSPICDGCLNKILETCDYKRNSMKTLVEMKKQIIDCEKPIRCQKCNSLCEQGHSLSLIDCVIQIDWSDFVNYLLPDQDSQLLKSLQICGSCQISMSNIQDFLKLIYVHDQSKMKCVIDTSNSNNINTTEHENLMRDKVEVKQEFEHFMHDKTEIQNIIKVNKAEIKHLTENIKEEIICSDKEDGDTIYADFKCKNEEVDLKFEDEDSDVNHSTDRCEKPDVPEEITLCGGPNRNSSEEERGVNSQGCINRLSDDLKVQNNIQDFKCTLCSKYFTDKRTLDNHLLIVHKSRDKVTNKIHECDKCSYSTTRKFCMVRHKLKHGLTVGHKKYKCQHCIYETYEKSNLIKHIKIHNIRDFKCNLCSNRFTQIETLDNHFLIVHKSKDNITSKIFKCDACSYETTIKSNLLRHRLNHGITVGLTYKCQNCIFETCHKSNLIRHVKTHNNQRFTQREFLEDHLLKVHKNENNVTRKIHKCDVCSYKTTNKSNLLRHKLRHGITEGHKKYKCQHCTYETYTKSHLIRHVKTHNIRDFKCILCLKDFTQKIYLDDHLLKFHKRKDFTSKIHECDVCKYATTIHHQWLNHKQTHNNIQDLKCTLCSKSFAQKKTLDNHLLKLHKSIDNITSKIHECDSCSYETTIKRNLLKHKLKHGITIGFEKYKCQHCIYETYNKSHLIRHIKTHSNIRDFKCTLCSKNFTRKKHLDNHLLKVHKDENNVASKIHECYK